MQSSSTVAASAIRFRGEPHPEAERSGVRKTVGEVLNSPPSPASPAVDFTFLELPTPPSANGLFRNKASGGRADSKAYHDWKGHAGWRLREQRPEPVHGRVLILVNIERPSERADVDNRIKALFDLLVKHRVIDDDRFIMGFLTAWALPGEGVVRLAIMPAQPMEFQFKLTLEGRHGGFFFDAPQLPEMSV